jgi:hypothetical protein
MPQWWLSTNILYNLSTSLKALTLKMWTWKAPGVKVKSNLNFILFPG